MKLKKGDKYHFTCMNIIEATPDFILYRVKDCSGDYNRYIEKYRPDHLIEKAVYEAVVTGKCLKGTTRPTLLTQLKIKPIEEDGEPDRDIYRVEYSQLITPVKGRVLMRGTNLLEDLPE